YTPHHLTSTLLPYPNHDTQTTCYPDSNTPPFSLFSLDAPPTTQLSTLSLHDALPISEPHRDPDLDGEPAPPPRALPEGVGDEAEEGAGELDPGEHAALHEDPADDDELRDEAEQARAARPPHHRERQEVARGAAREDAAVGAAVGQDAAAALRLRHLDPQGVLPAREVHVGVAALVVVVEAGDVRPHAVHGRHLEGRRRGGQTDAHRREPPAPLPDE